MHLTLEYITQRVLSSFVLVLATLINYGVIDMTHIVTDAESNPKLREIYEILLLAGYFRIRIGSLKAFDKIVGGLAWCITCSNFDVDVEYNDEMQIGQKIKVAEKVCDALKNMKCPFNIQPFQLQGLDLNAIYPLLQWLIKFVYETREARQKFNTRLSDYLAKDIIPPKEIVSAHQIVLEAKRIKKNAQSQQMSKKDPLRVYSTLLEFDDVTSASTYNKLCAIVGGKVTNTKATDKKGPNLQSNQKNLVSNDKEEFNLSSYLFETSQDASEGNIKAMLQVGSEEKKKFQEIDMKVTISGKELEKIVTENKDKIEQALKQAESEEEDTPESKMAKSLKEETDNFESQKKLLEQKSKTLESKQATLESRISEIKSVLSEVTEKVSEEQSKLDEFREAKTDFEGELKAKNLKEKETKALQKLVEQRAKLKTRKQEVKRLALAQIQQLNKNKSKALQSVPQIDEEVYAKMWEQLKRKKKIHSQKFLQLTELNQQLAVLQRKVEKITSPPEIAQYHKRLTEIYESINLQIEERKDLMARHQQSQGVSKIAQDYLELISSFKESYINSKSKTQKREFIEALQVNIGALEANEKSGNSIMKSVMDTRKRNLDEYNDMVKLEKEYFRLRKELTMEMEADNE